VSGVNIVKLGQALDTRLNELVEDLPIGVEVERIAWQGDLVDASIKNFMVSLAEAVGYRHRILPWLVFAGGLLGAAGGFGLQYWVHVVELPSNIGGRPLLSWPAFIPVTFECTILAAALTAVFGMLALNGLPQPYHPVFNHPRFGMASTDRFFLVVQARDERFEREGTERFLEIGRASCRERV